MTAPGTDPLPECGRCAGRFESSIAVFVLDALAPTLTQAPLAEATHFASFLLETAERACSGIFPGPDTEQVAQRVQCVAAAHLANYIAPSGQGNDRSPAPHDCSRPLPAALDAFGDLLVTDPERGLALLRRAADDFYGH